MRATIKTLLQTSTIAVAGIFASGCAVVPAPAPVAVADEAVYAPLAPPPPQAEIVPALPFVGAVWVGGYWNWSGGRHVWMPGHYVQPRPGYRWQPHAWRPHPGGGWALHGGIWVR